MLEKVIQIMNFAPILFWGSVGLFFILFVLLALIIFTTKKVTIPFMLARILNKHIMAITKRNGTIDFVRGDYKAGTGTIETEEHGDWFLIPDGIYQISGVPMSIGFEDFGINLSEELVVASNRLKESGYQSFLEVPKLKKFYKKMRRGEENKDKKKLFSTWRGEKDSD